MELRNHLYKEYKTPVKRRLAERGLDLYERFKAGMAGSSGTDESERRAAFLAESKAFAKDFAETFKTPRRRKGCLLFAFYRLGNDSGRKRFKGLYELTDGPADRVWYDAATFTEIFMRELALLVEVNGLGRVHKFQCLLAAARLLVDGFEPGTVDYADGFRVAEHVLEVVDFDRLVPFIREFNPRWNYRPDRTGTTYDSKLAGLTPALLAERVSALEAAGLSRREIKGRLATEWGCHYKNIERKMSAAGLTRAYAKGER